MIVNWFLQMVCAILSGFMGLLPSYTLPADMIGWGQQLGSSVATANGLFPVVELGICLGVLVGVWVFTSAWNLVIYVYKLIPLKAT